MKKVAVLYGGWAHESFLCAFPSVTASIKRLGYITKELRCDSPSFIGELVAFRPDIAFMASHGAYHEDGKLQGVLEWLDIPYVGSSVGASAVGMNKVLFKHFLRGIGVATAPYIVIERGEVVPNFAEATNVLDSAKVMIKPVSSGASIGLKLVDGANQYQRHIDSLLNEFGSCLVEKFLSGCREFSVGVHDLDDVVTSLPVCELHTGGEVFDFGMKNGYSSLDKSIPAKINDKLSQKMQKIAVQIHSELGAQGYSRIDMLLTQDFNVSVLEINTLPGLMPQSVLPKSFENTGISYDAMIEKILNAAKKPKRFEVAKQYTNQPTLSDSVIASMSADS